MAEDQPSGWTSWQLGCSDPRAFGRSQKKSAHFLQCGEGGDGIPMKMRIIDVGQFLQCLAKKLDNWLWPPHNWPKKSVVIASIGRTGKQTKDITRCWKIVGYCCWFLCIVHVASLCLHHFKKAILNGVLIARHVSLIMLVCLQRHWERNLRLAVFPKGFEASLNWVFWNQWWISPFDLSWGSLSRALPAHTISQFQAWASFFWPLALDSICTLSTACLVDTMIFHPQDCFTHWIIICQEAIIYSIWKCLKCWQLWDTPFRQFLVIFHIDLHKMMFLCLSCIFNKWNPKVGWWPSNSCKWLVFWLIVLKLWALKRESWIWAREVWIDWLGTFSCCVIVHSGPCITWSQLLCNSSQIFLFFPCNSSQKMFFFLENLLRTEKKKQK